MIPIRTLSWGAVIAAFAVATTLPAQISITNITLNTDPAPGTPSGVTNFVLGAATINDSGRVAYRATLQGIGVGSVNNEGVWSGFPASLALAARKADAAPGAGSGVTYNGFLSDPPVLNQSNQLAFRALLIGAGVGAVNNEGIWVGAPGSLSLLTRKGSNAPGTSAGVIFDAFTSPLVLNEAGQAAFRAALTGAGVGAFNNEGIWAGASGTLQLAVRTGSHAPGTGSGVNFDGVSDPALSAAGHVLFHGTLTGVGVGGSNNEGLWSGLPGALSLVARKGASAPGAGTGVNFNGFTVEPTINSSNIVAFGAVLTGAGVGAFNNEGIWSGPASGVALVARKGSPAPGTASGVNFNGFGAPSLGIDGKVAFRASLTGTGVGALNDGGVWVGPPGGVVLLAREGEAAPGTQNGVTFGSFDSDPVINRNGQVLFKAILTGSGVSALNDEGLWATDADGALRLVVRENQSLDIGGGRIRTINSLLSGHLASNGEDGRPAGWNQTGQAAIPLGFIGNTNGLFIANITSAARLTFGFSGTNLVLGWTGGGFTLEQASNITGPWSVAPDQANPQVVPAAGDARFFRLRQ